MFRASRLLPRLAPRAALGAPISQTLLRLQAPRLLPAAQGIRFASKSSDDPPPPKWPIDREHEKKVAQQKLKSDPSKVSEESSAGSRFDFSPTATAPTVPSGSPKDNPEISSGLKHDIEIVKDTFRLSSVPRESYILGFAGTVPYLGTSLSTMFLAWDLNQTWPSGNWLKDAVLIDHETAQHLLTIIEPVQLGYGAVIISFLGAIHWGLEYAEKAPHPERTRFRYGMGLAASIIAWPTLFMPLEYALTTQFMAFIALYFADSRAATRGWAPYWYGTYRFLLTAMVGIAIFVSLVGRSKIGQTKHLTEESMTKSGIADNTTNWAKLEEEERRKRKEKEKKEAEEQAKKEKEEEEKAKKEKKGGKKKKSKDAKAASKDEDEDGDAEQSDDDAGKSDEDGDDDEDEEKKDGDDKKDDDGEDEEQKDKKSDKKAKKKDGDNKTKKEDEGKDEESKDEAGEGDDAKEGEDKESEEKQDDDSKDEDIKDEDIKDDTKEEAEEKDDKKSDDKKDKKSKKKES